MFLPMDLKPGKTMGLGGQGASPHRGCAQRAQRKPTEGLLRRKSSQGKYQDLKVRGKANLAELGQDI